MTRSAATMLEDAGVNIHSRWRLQIAKVHEDLAYRLSAPLSDWAIVTLATADGAITERHFDGAHALRKARGWLGRLKRGEESL